MERPSRSKATTMLKYLQKAATFTLSSHPHSPRGGLGRQTARGFSGPLLPIIPSDIRHRKRSEVETVTEEPISPKVTCIGQVKHKNKASSAEARAKARKKKVSSGVSRTYSQRVRPSVEKEKERSQQPGIEAAVAATPPPFGQMKKYASGRETLSNFRWETAAAEETSEDDDEKNEKQQGLGGCAVETDLKEVGIWRRRAVAALTPLMLNTK